MLSRLRIKNFKSFMNDTQVLLNKSNYKILEDTNVSTNGILKGALFVGGNATGKTNLILSLRLLLELLFKDEFNLLFFNKCLMCSDNLLMELEYTFTIDKSIISYLIKYDFSQKVLIEELSKDDEKLIDRKGNVGESSITENKVFTDIPNNHLLLREIYFNTKFREHEILQKWFKFLTNSAYINPYKNTITNSGAGVTNSLLDYLKEDDVIEINKFFNEFNFDQRIEFEEESEGENYLISNKDKEKSIFFRRLDSNIPIPFTFESLGNQNLVKMLPIYLHIINNGGMLIIDEFSSGFHNSLEELLVRYFMENTKESQLFIVSHSTNLLSNTIFRPDQIYTVDFDKSTGSEIYRISNEKPREAQNIEKMYLNGVFKGIPDFKNEN